MDFQILPVDFSAWTGAPVEPFRSTTECPYVRWDMIAIGVGIGIVAMYLLRK